MEINSTASIIKSSFKLPIVNHRRFILSILLLYFPIILIGMGLKYANTYYDRSFRIYRFYYSLISLLAIPFELSVFVSNLKILEDENSTLKSRLYSHVYIQYVVILTAISVISTAAIIVIPLRNYFAAKILTTILGGLIIAVRFIGVLTLPISFNERIKVRAAIKRTFSLIKPYWESYIVLFVLYGLLNKIMSLLLGLAASKQNLVKVTTNGDSVSYLGLIAFFAVLFIRGLFLAVEITGMNLFYRRSVNSERDVFTSESK